MKKMINYIIAFSVIRGFFGFLFIPLLWLLSPSCDVLISFWEESFFSKGINVFDLRSTLLGVSFYLGFLFVTLSKNKIEFFYELLINRFNKHSNLLKERYSLNEHFAYLLLFLWITLKIWTIVFDFSYFDHVFFNGSHYNSLYQRIATHMFLPNVLLISGAYVLYLSKNKSNQLIGLFLLILALAASLNYGSRGLFTITFLVALFATLSKMKIKPFVIGFAISILLIIVLNSAYTDQGVLAKFEGLILRLDMYHVILHTQVYGGFDLSQGVNEYSRRIGLISTLDKNTGVGFPLFLLIDSEASIIWAVISGVLMGLILMLLYFMQRTIPSLQAVILWSLLYLSLHWVEMSGASLLTIFRNVTVIYCVYLFVVFCNRYLLFKKQKLKK